MRFLRFRVRQIPRSARRSTNSGWCPADRITEFETDDVVNSPQFRIGFNGGRLARVLPRNHLAPAPCRGFETVGTSTNHIRGPPTRNPARKHLLKTRAVWSFSRQYSKHKKTCLRTHRRQNLSAPVVDRQPVAKSNTSSFLTFPTSPSGVINARHPRTLRKRYL